VTIDRALASPDRRANAVEWKKLKIHFTSRREIVPGRPAEKAAHPYVTSAGRKKGVGRGR
jgi:hypothetical protein